MAPNATHTRTHPHPHAPTHQHTHTFTQTLPQLQHTCIASASTSICCPSPWLTRTTTSDSSGRSCSDSWPWGATWTCALPPPLPPTASGVARRPLCLKPKEGWAALVLRERPVALSQSCALPARAAAPKVLLLAAGFVTPRPTVLWALAYRGREIGDWERVRVFGVPGFAWLPPSAPLAPPARPLDCMVVAGQGGRGVV